MGLGLGSLAKSYVPLAFYIIGIIFVFIALSGRVHWVLMTAVFLSPLRNVIEKLQPYPLGKDYLDVLVIAMLAGWILRALSKGEKVLESSPLNLPSIILIIYSYFTLIYGFFYLNYYDFFNIQDVRVQDWKNFCLFPLFFWITFNNIKEKKWVWYTILVMCVANAFMDLYQVRQISWFSSIVSRDKISGTFVDLGPNEVAAFYNMYTIILFSLFFAVRKQLIKWALFGLILINIYCIVFLFSRAAYLGLAVGLFFLFAFKKKILLVPLLAAMLCWQMVLPQEVKDRIEMTTNEYGELDASSQTRIVVWEQSVELFKRSPIVGVGFGVFRYMGFALKDTHNIYLKILAEQGIIGFVIFLSILAVFFSQGVRLFRRGEDDLAKALGLGFAICIIVLMVNNLFGNRWTYLQLSTYLWVYAGLVARMNSFADIAFREKLAIRQKEENKKLYGRNYRTN